MVMRVLVRAEQTGMVPIVLHVPLAKVGTVPVVQGLVIPWLARCGIVLVPVVCVRLEPVCNPVVMAMQVPVLVLYLMEQV